MDWRWLTTAGNGLLLWPAALLATWLLVRDGSRSMHGGLRWLGWLAAACALVIASKIAFYGWGTGVRAWDLTCFSGHTVLALGTWPILLAILVPPARPRLRQAMAALGLGLGLLVGVSRIAVGAHPLSEVVAGALLGGATAWASLQGLRTAWLPRRGACTLLAAALALALWDGSGTALRLPSERWFAQAGMTLAGHQRPYRRKSWQQGQVPPSAGTDPLPGADPPTSTR